MNVVIYYVLHISLVISGTYFNSMEVFYFSLAVPFLLYSANNIALVVLIQLTHSLFPLVTDVTLLD